MHRGAEVTMRLAVISFLIAGFFTFKAAFGDGTITMVRTEINLTRYLKKENLEFYLFFKVLYKIRTLISFTNILIS